MTHVEQVGGTHYAAEYQHWDWVEEHRLDYLIATSTKYLVRAERKGTFALDVGKGISYIKKALAMRTGPLLARAVASHAKTIIMLDQAGVQNADLRQAVLLLAVRGSRLDAERALVTLRELLEGAGA